MADPKDIEQLIKDGTIKHGNDPELIVHRIPVGIAAFDNLIGGGIPVGRCIELIGDESTGKTLLAQYMIAAVQKTENDVCLYLDMERSYDEPWWRQSGVDTDKLLVSSPTTAEQAIDIMTAVCRSEEHLGLIFVDSLAAMVPMPEMDPERTAQDNRPLVGAQARVITSMYHKIVPLLNNKTTLLVTNQMRESIGGYSELSALPGGHAQRHYNHIILKTRRDSWMKDNNGEPFGFYMEVTSRKNKLCNTPDGTDIMLPFLATSGIDMLTAFLEEGIKKKAIEKKGPYYKWANHNVLGMANLRRFFDENPQELEDLENALKLV